MNKRTKTNRTGSRLGAGFILLLLLCASGIGTALPNTLAAPRPACGSNSGEV